MKGANIKKITPYILILSGFTIIIIVSYLKISTTHYQNKLVEQYDEYISQLNIDKNIEKEHRDLSIDDGIISETQESGGYEEAFQEEEKEKNPVDKYLQGKELSGVIEIPKLGVVAAILEGTDDTALKYTVGHYPGTANPGEKGNYVLLGHRNYVYGHYFRRIDELNPGDEVIIKKDLETYTYLVSESFVVSPEEVWVLEDTEETVLTMITCTPIITYTDRLIVRCLISE